MSNQRWLEWMHGEGKARIGSLPKPTEPGKPVTEVEVFEDTTYPKEASPSEPED